MVKILSVKLKTDCGGFDALGNSLHVRAETGVALEKVDNNTIRVTLTPPKAKGKRVFDLYTSALVHTEYAVDESANEKAK